MPKQNLDAYKEMSRKASEVWMDHGALSYVECLADDVAYGELTSFPRAVQARDDELEVFARATYKDRAARNEIMTKIMEDPRMKYDPVTMPFDGKRMIWGGV